MSTKDFAEEVKEKGRLFAKDSVGKYRASKYPKVKESTSDAAKPAHTNDDKKKENENSCLVPVHNPEVQSTVNIPTKSGESSAALTATSGPSAGLGSNTLVGPSATKSKDLEHAVYFESWGKPQERTGPAAGKRKVIITGDPAWEYIPKPDFIASLVFGGPLEQITCLISCAIVVFINPDDAQAFYDATPNGIIIRQTPDSLHCAEIKLHDDVTPVSSLVQQYVNNGATRCVKATGINVITPSEDLYRLGIGPMNSRGQLPRRLERLTDDMTLSGHRVITFRFCDIRHAVAFMTQVARLVDYEEVNFQYARDPVAEATGPRVDLSPST